MSPLSADTLFVEGRKYMEKQNLFFTYRVLLGILSLSSLCLIEYLSPMHPFYLTQNENLEKVKTQRSPANFLNYKNRDLRIYQDYFSYNSFQKYLHYDMTIDLRTSKSQRSFNKKVELALHKSLIQNIEKNIQIPESQELATTLIQENLIANYINNFVNNLKSLKIENGTFQINLSFIPKTIKKKSYTKELNTNQLINWSQKHDLLNDIDQKPAPLNQQILNAEIPSTKSLYQYRGGQITIWFDITNTKGFIRYRRYFKTSNLNKLKPFIQTNELEITKIELKREKKFPNNFITVDIIREVDLENFTTQLKRVELHFSKLLSSYFHKNNILEKKISYDDKSIRTGEFTLRGNFKHLGRKLEFKTKLKNIIYDFEKQSFSSKSKISTTLTNHPRYTKQNAGKLKLKIRYKLLGDFGIYLIEALKMGRLHNTMTLEKK